MNTTVNGLRAILDIEDKNEQGAALLKYGGERVERARQIFGDDSEQYAESVKRWSFIIRQHLAYAE